MNISSFFQGSFNLPWTSIYHSLGTQLTKEQALECVEDLVYVLDDTFRIVLYDATVNTIRDLQEKLEFWDDTAEPLRRRCRKALSTFRIADEISCTLRKFLECPETHDFEYRDALMGYMA